MDWLKESQTEGLRFKPLDIDTLKLVIISDASFGNAKGYRNRLGFVVLLADRNGKDNIVHFTSNILKSVTSSVLSAEVHSLVLAFEDCFLIQDMDHDLPCRRLDIDEYVDSLTPFYVVPKDIATT